MARTPEVRTQLFVVLLCVVLYLGHFLVFTWPQPFYIEDSGISFSYARNLVNGEGLVPYPGGEPVEGFSNALWTFLIAGFYAIGVPVWTSAKLMGAVFGSATLFFAWGLARRARPDAKDPLAVAAPFLLACSTQFVLWNASGLENSLFNLLLAAGMWSLVREIQDDVAVPWSAFCFVGLTMTRPDGLAYAALALATRVMGTAARRQWRALPLWIVAFAVVYVPYNAWRYEYFAWWFPNTYFAKEKAFRPFAWTGAGWKQVKDYCTQYGIVYAAPLVVIAVTGLSSWRRWIGALLLAFLAVFLLWDGRAHIPVSMAGKISRAVGSNWSDARIWYLLGASVVLGLLAFGRKGWEARGMLWAAFCGGVFFCVWSNGDWMKGLRWFSQTSVPIFTLLGIGIGALVERLPWAEKRFAGWLPVKAFYAVPMMVAIGFPNINGTNTFAHEPETAVRDVDKRVKYMTWVQHRLGLDHVTLLDVDMGAHLWFSGWDMVDIAGLIDLPMAHHHKYPKSFISEYIFEERRPDFAHVHGAWANTSRINKDPRWAEDYIEIPGYPSGRRALHVGNNVRKDHLVGKAYTGPAGRLASFGGGVTMEGWDVPSPQIAAGGKLYLSTTWTAGFRKDGFRVVAFLADAAGHFHAAEVEPGYDWYKPETWQPDEHVYGNWSIAVPESLPTGTYDLGLVLLDEASGDVLPYMPPGQADVPGVPASAVAGDPPATSGSSAAATPVRYMVGEWLAPGAVTIVKPDAALAAADADYQGALDRAARGDCDGAQETFRNARRHVARNDHWYLAHVDAVESATVACYVARAGLETDLYAQARLLAQGRVLDHKDPGLLAATVPLAKKLVAVGDTARAASDWAGSYKAYAAALTVDPTLTWTRRAAEEVRDLRLGLTADGEDPPAAARAAPAKRPGKGPAGAANKPDGGLDGKPDGKPDATAAVPRVGGPERGEDPVLPDAPQPAGDAADAPDPIGDAPGGE